MDCSRGGGVATTTVGTFLIGVCEGFVVLNAELVTGVFLSFAPSSRSFSLLEPPVSLDIIRWKRPVDFRDDTAGDCGGGGDVKSVGGP